MLEEYMGLGGELSRRLLEIYGKLRTDPCCMSGPADTADRFNRH